ncbi:MAG: response regulator [Elusimicrobia bacterium]|nr:response regulator [Elusimicrobiota bacterium]
MSGKVADSLNEIIVSNRCMTGEVARVISAVAKGDLSQRMVLEIDGRPVKGEFLRIAKIVNPMVDQLSSLETNEKLEEKVRLLSAQKEEIEAKNREVELAKKALEEKARQLALTSKYKSQFLANMSHELRTPLNSLLILAKVLQQNLEGNLTKKQIDYVETVHSSGSDLLALINEILDMSKIESGMITVESGVLEFSELRDYLDRIFRQVALDRGLEFRISLAEDLPKSLLTDAKRCQQVLKNLLSNAFKFTERGSVTLTIGPAPKNGVYDNPALQSAETVLSFSVLDTGVGIPPDKRRIIFEAFQQADMTTSRKYGGTGLGLTISREIAKILGGEIRVEGGEQGGALFTLLLPASYVSVEPQSPAEEVKSEFIPPMPRAEASPATCVEQAPAVSEVKDDRENVGLGDKVLLIVEGDPHCARIMLKSARKAGFKGLVAQRGDGAITIARKARPDGIMLDINLPDMNGCRVLDLLKHHHSTRHIPVHVLSAIGDQGRLARLYRMGALACLRKPATKKGLSRTLTSLKDFIDRKLKKLLIIEDNDVRREAIAQFVGGDDIGVTTVSTGAEALKALQRETYDCMVLDLSLSDMTGFTLLDKVRKDASLRRLPVVVYTSKELSPHEEARLKNLAESVVITDAQSPETLLEETSLYLHRSEANMPDDKRRLIEKIRQEDPGLENKTVLIVDDDVRNIFALTCLLEQHKAKILNSESGKGALEILQGTPSIDIVLMDVMMPDMDGYETMRAIRKIAGLRRLPIIALTAKALKGDRAKCLQAGASDYITKPVNIPQLLSMLRMWSR